MSTQRRRPYATYVLFAVAAAVGATAGFAYAETAAIKITATPQRLQASVALNQGGATLAIKHIDVVITETTHVTATGAVSNGGTYAGGQVRFLYACQPVALPCQLPFTLPPGTAVATARGFTYTTLSAATFRVGPGNQYQTVGIRASVPGSAGNTGPNTVTAMQINPRPQFLSVSNPSAVGGGTDGVAVHVIQQSDVDAAQAALAARVTDELGSGILAQANGLAYLVDGPPALDFTSDHAVGDKTPDFTLTMSGEVGAEAFSTSAAQAILRNALQPLVAPGYALSAEPVQANYHLMEATGSSGVLIMADAVGYALPNLSTATVRARLKGLSLSDARSRLRHDFPGSSIDIRTKPLALPWLPLVADHISLTVVVKPAV